ncbi:MAG: DUF2442 domain-containing protein [Bacteroidales bacterium]|jgi:hypothetical protein|nr:DUF2442 domain-containing protein [Bacteroidales bacterium]MDY6403482.1 DUF2442 domain-containing protein [Bacteroidales bacterium]
MNTLLKSDNIENVFFTEDSIVIVSKDGEDYRQNLKYYPLLEHATKEERENFYVSSLGLHWRNLDTDISFESFSYDFSKPFVYHS